MFVRKVSNLIGFHGLIAISALLAMALPAGAIEKKAVQDALKPLFDKESAAWAKPYQQQYVDGIAAELADVPEEKSQELLASVCRETDQLLSNTELHPLVFGVMRLGTIEHIRDYKLAHNDDMSPEQQAQMLKVIQEILADWQTRLDNQNPGFHDMHAQVMKEGLESAKRWAANPLSGHLKRSVSESQLKQAFEAAWIKDQEKILGAAQPKPNASMDSVRFELDAEILSAINDATRAANRPERPRGEEYEKAEQTYMKNVAEIGQWEEHRWWERINEAKIRAQAEFEFRRMMEKPDAKLNQWIGLLTL